MSLFQNTNNDAALTSGPPTVLDVALNGFFVSQDGYTRCTSTGAIVNYSQGVPIDANGSVCVSQTNAIASYNNGLPFDSTGRLCIAGTAMQTVLNGLPMNNDGKLCSLTMSALSILATYGTDAHLWLPGVGAVNGITAGNFSDTAGTTAAVVDSTAGVGLVVDAGGGTINATQGTTAAKPILRRGAVNRLLQTGFTGGTGGTVGSGAVAPTGWVFVNTGGSVTYQPAASGLGNSIRFTAAGTRPAIGQSFTVLAGMTYTISYRVEAVHSGAVSIENLLNPGAIPAGASLSYKLNGVTVPGSTNVVVAGLIQITVAVGATGGVMQPRFGPGAGTTATVDITCSNPQLETGSTANTYIPTTTAAASSPTGPMYWEMDGTDDRLQLSAVPFQASDDSCVIAGVNHSDNTATTRGLFSISGAASQRVSTLYVNNRSWRYQFVDDTATAQEIITVNTNNAGTPVVVSGRKVGNTRVIRMNGVQEATNSTPVGATTITTAQIASVTPTGAYAIGNIGPVIAIKGTVSDADLLTLEKWVGSLSGVTI